GRPSRRVLPRRFDRTGGTGPSVAVRGGTSDPCSRASPAAAAAACCVRCKRGRPKRSLRDEERELLPFPERQIRVLPGSTIAPEFPLPLACGLAHALRDPKTGHQKARGRRTCTFLSTRCPCHRRRRERRGRWARRRADGFLRSRSCERPRV